jgi:hypothetical protein
MPESEEDEEVDFELILENRFGIAQGREVSCGLLEGIRLDQVIGQGSNSVVFGGRLGERSVAVKYTE